MRTLFLIALLMASPAVAQDRSAEVDKIFGWVRPGMPGCAVAASVNGTLVVNRAYGLADLERNVPLTVDSVFDAASIRKQFVAAAILLLVEEKRLSLADDVRKYVPELPDYGRTITLDHMLAHTSGLRDWISLRNYNGGSEPALPMILRQRSLDFAPGDEWSYSNSGYVLLTEIVARVTTMPFAEFARTRLFEPLGMKATTYVDDLSQVIPNRALAYEPQGKGWRVEMLIGNERGGGGALFSTARDLVTWNDALAGARLGAFVTEKLHEPATLSNGRRLDYGRGIFLNTNYAGPFFMHGGGAAAYRSILTRFPGRGMSVAVLCNAGEASDDRDAFAARVFDLGLFFNEQTGRPLRLGASNGRLVVAGGGALIAITKDRFRIARPTMELMSQDAFELQFLSADQFEYR
jgi:CubicO group peptidase (beta-lactamase class C family)